MNNGQEMLNDLAPVSFFLMDPRKLVDSPGMHLAPGSRETRVR